jgi:hypothetical protein
VPESCGSARWRVTRARSLRCGQHQVLRSSRRAQPIANRPSYPMSLPCVNRQRLPVNHAFRAWSRRHEGTWGSRRNDVHVMLGMRTHAPARSTVVQGECCVAEARARPSVKSQMVPSEVLGRIASGVRGSTPRAATASRESWEGQRHGPSPVALPQKLL